MKPIQTWCAGSLLTILAVGISVAWLDKPIAHLIHDTFGQFEALASFTGTPSFFSPLAMLVFLIFLARRIAFRPFGKLDSALILSVLSIILAKLIVLPLKFAFGRTWPRYHYPSLIGDGVYGFNFFHAGEAFESFPSGHTASICALTFVFWICYPRFRPMYAGGIVVLAGGLIVGNYHFLSDVIAGGFVGFSTAVLVASVWETWDRWRVRGGVSGFTHVREDAPDQAVR